MTFETQKDFSGKTRTIVMAEIQSERRVSWIRLAIAGFYFLLSIYGFLLEKTSNLSFTIQIISVLALITFSVYYLFINNTKLFNTYLVYLIVSLDVVVITLILGSYYINGSDSYLITNAVFCTYFIAITFTSLHYKINLPIFCGIMCVFAFTILYVLLKNAGMLTCIETDDYILRISVLMVVAGLGRIVSRNNARIIQQVISSEIKYLDLIHRLPEMFCTLDSHGNFLWSNIASHSVLGIPAKVLQGRNLRSFLVNPEIFRLDRNGIKGTFEINDFGGNRRFVDCIIQSVADENGNVSYEGIISDVTDRELAISQREEMVNRLFQYQKMESLGTLASGMAHDFNNILQTVNDLTMTVKKESAEPETKQKMELVNDTLTDARFLVSELFALGRKQPLDYHPIHVQDFMERVVTQFRKQLGNRYKITLATSKNPLWIHGDPDYLKRIFQNLFGNARDSMLEGGTIKVSCSRPIETEGHHPEIVVIRVSDTGQGIAQDLTEKIFDPFFTTKKAGKGTGLGLALVRRIVMLHNGTIMVEKTGSGGTTFKIELPAGDETDFEINRRAIFKDRLHTTVLLLDDDPKIREVLKIFLLEFKYSVLEASNSEEAIKGLLENKNYCNILIMDWKLGNEDPHYVIRRLRTIKNDLIILVVSGYAPETKSIKKMKIHRWFTKPYDKNQLDIEIQKVLRKITITNTRI